MNTTTQPTCAWCGQPAADGNCIHTACELLCYEAACLWERASFGVDDADALIDALL